MARNIAKKLDVNDYSFVHLTLILSLHYLVKCRSRSLAVCNNDFILGNAYIGSKVINRDKQTTIRMMCKADSTMHVVGLIFGSGAGGLRLWQWL